MTAEAPAPGLRQNRNWRRLWLGQSVSVVGDMVFLITVMLWIATKIANGQPWAPAAVSGALLASAVPALVVGPFAGVWVDRWDRRRIMLTADAARFILIGCLLILPALRHTIPVTAQLAILYAVLAGASCFAEFFDPSRMAIIGAIVPPADRPKASSQLTAVGALAQVIGPPLAAPLLIVFGVQWALIINAASFGISFLCVRAIHPPTAIDEAAPERASFWTEFRAGIGFFFGSKVLVALGGCIVLAMLGLGAVNSLAVFFIPHDLHVSTSWLGTVAGAVGVGAIAGAMGAGKIAGRVPLGRLFWLGSCVAGAGVTGLAFCTDLPAAIAVCLLIGLGTGVLNAVFEPLILQVTPQHLLGRVNSVISPMIQLASIASMALAGLLASTVLRGFHQVVAGVVLGPYNTIFAVAGLLFLAGGLTSIAPMQAAVSAGAGDQVMVGAEVGTAGPAA
jgi:MFS family permease